MEEAPRGAAHRAAPRRVACLGAVRAGFERALADPVDPAIASAEIASELRRGADYVRVTLVLTVAATDVADGGETSVKECVLLCPFHHQVVIHRWGWTLVVNPDGTTTAWNKS